MKRTILILTMLFALNLNVLAQKVELHLIPDSPTATYRVGEQARMKVIALDCGVAIYEGEVSYEVSEDLMPAREKNTVKLNGPEATIKVGTMKEAGFLRVRAKIEYDGKSYSTTKTIGFDPEKLEPTTKMPKDFDEFWQKSLEQLSKVKLNPTMELLPERCTDKVNSYLVSYGNINNTRMYGILTVPKAEGKYPAIVRLPGAGVHAISGDVKHSEQGVIILELGIHGIPVNFDAEVYAALNRQPSLRAYHTINIDDRDTYYYRRVFLGCVKAIDFFETLPQYNGKVGTLGGSQGGLLSIVVSRLDPRVKASAIYFPAFCDQEGYINRRAGGWPHTFKNEDNRTEKIIVAQRYYDAVNFARGLKAPVFYAFGYNDITCAPTTTQSTYNIITAPKQLCVSPNTGHWLPSEHVAKMWNWIIDELKK